MVAFYPMMNKILLIAGCLLAGCMQAQTDSLFALHSIDMAKRCLKEEKWDSVDLHINAARQYFQGKDQLAPWLKTYTSLAYVWGGDLKNPSEGVKLIEQSFQKKWRNPVNETEWEQYTMSLLAAGHILRVNAADYLGAKLYYEKAQSVFLGPLTERSDRVARYLYHNLGNIYTRLGDYERAINLFRRSLNYHRLYPQAQVVDHGDLAIALNEVGLHEEALSVVRQGLQVADLSSDLMISLYQNEGEALFKSGHPELAIRSLDKIPGFVRKMKREEEHPDADNYLSQYHASKAEVLLSLKKYEEANGHARAAVTTALEFWGTEKRREIGKTYVLLGNIHLAKNQPREALKYFHKALLSVVVGFSEENLEATPDPKLFYPENTILEALHGKARAFAVLGFLDHALSCYELIPIVEAKLRATHVYENSSLLALKESRIRFEEAVGLAWNLFERSKGHPAYAERAFRLAELSRGMLLLQSLMQSRQYLPEAIKTRDYELKAQMAWLEHEIAQEKEKGQHSTATRLSLWEQQLYQLKLERQRLLADFPSYNHPDSVVLEVLFAKDLYQLLRPGQAMISYFLTGPDAYVFSFQPGGGLEWRKWTLPDDFSLRVKSLIQFLWDKQETQKESFLQEAYQFYQWLIAPEREGFDGSISSLFIVPDGVLMMLPFEVLLTTAPSPTRPNWRDQPWLLWQYNVSYGYSATLLKAQMDIRRQNISNPASFSGVFGGFAPNYSEAGSYRLQNTTPMVKKIRSMLGGDVWVEEPAMESIFKQRASEYQILLLAMHGISNPEQPELSRLLFGDPGPDSSANNNILYASELQIMQLRADLVVLSACHSGSGKLEQGEGVYSLARAFAAAGVPATVMSMWLLHENAAPPLVESFFSNLTRGMTKDEALRRSKQEYLKNDAYFELTHPFYWAGLVATGDMQPVAFSGKTYLSWWLGVGALLLVLMSWFFIKNRTKTNIRA